MAGLRKIRTATGYGHLILIEHTVGGQQVATGYAHMYANDLHVVTGDSVTAGQYIADVGSDGYSTGSHLHFEIRPGGADGAPIDPEPWLASNGASNVEGGAAGRAAGCGTGGGPASPYSGERPDNLVDDPDVGGPDHRADRPRPRRGPEALPRHPLVLLVRASRNEVGAPPRPRL